MEQIAPESGWVFANHATRLVTGAGVGAFNARYGLADALLPECGMPTVIQNKMPADFPRQEKFEFAQSYVDDLLGYYSAPDFVVTGWGDFEATKMTMALKQRCPETKIIFIGGPKQLRKITDEEARSLDIILCPSFLIAEGRKFADPRVQVTPYIPHHLVKEAKSCVPGHINEWINEQNKQRFSLLLIGAPDHKDFGTTLQAQATDEIIHQIQSLRSLELGGILISSSPRTPEAVFKRIKKEFALDDTVLCYEWQPNDPNNPYPGVLNHPNLHCVGITPDTISMPCEALISGRPLMLLNTGQFWCVDNSVSDCLTQMMAEDLIVHIHQIKSHQRSLSAPQPFCTTTMAATAVCKFFKWQLPAAAPIGPIL